MCYDNGTKMFYSEDNIRTGEQTMTNEQKREEKQKRLLERLQEMSYFDDEFMTKCLEGYPKGVEQMQI